MDERNEETARLCEALDRLGWVVESVDRELLTANDGYQCETGFVTLRIRRFAKVAP